jgi:lysophospholipase L1-like esterase
MALAASPDCPAKQEAFAADRPWRPNARPTSQAALRILAIGSSSTEGVGASGPDFTYPAQLQARLTDLLRRPVEVENAGIGGETITATVARLKTALEADKPDLVIWQVGTNDAVTGEDESLFRANLIDGITAIRATKTPFVLLDPQFYPGLKNVSKYEEYVRVVDDLGSHAGAVFSRYALMKEWGAESDDLLRSMLSKDVFHMSDRGYGCLARNLAADLAPFWRPVPVAASDKTPIAAGYKAASPSPIVK